jgi:hypothetical protein
MRTVTLELLRHGPPHNQLLSRLTQYLGLCGNHPAVSVNVPFDHAQFLVKLQALQYRDTDKTKALQIQDTADRMTEILASVPGLIAELAEFGDGCEQEMTHLRLILSANELALLPFELANAPNGFPGAGQSLMLQSQLPLVITREGRRVSNRFAQWKKKPKILFASAAPPGVAPVPREAHALALRLAIEPWVYHHATAVERESKVGEHLTVIADASIDELQRACSTGEYTHVHILAHGVQYEEGDDRRYGLALHAPYNPTLKDVVDGSRLAAALRPHTDRDDTTLTCPTFVTIASCEGGQHGTVVGAGASIAHAIHEAGIPLVVASQFPLSFSASVVMAEVLYNGLLNGGDPRRLLNDLRRQLKSRVPATHDWASIVAYASLPEDLGTQLSDLRIEQAKRSIEAALDHADTLVRKLSPRTPTPSKSVVSRTGATQHPQITDSLQQLKGPQARLKKARERLEELLHKGYQDEALIFGLLASTQKRLAEILWRAVSWHSTSSQNAKEVSEQQRTVHQEEAWVALRSARDLYWKAFQADWSQSWALVQHLVLGAVLGDDPIINQDHWHLAKLLSSQDVAADSRQRRAWAQSNIMELNLLAMLSPLLAPPPFDQNRSAADARTALKQFLQVVDPRTWEIRSTRRQLVRYVEFFNEVNPAFEHSHGLIEEFLPEIDRKLPPEWP